MLFFVFLSCIPIMVIIFQVKRLMDTRLLSRGWTWHVYIRGSAEYFLGFEFRESVFFWVLVTAAVFFGVVK